MSIDSGKPKQKQPRVLRDQVRDSGVPWPEVVWGFLEELDNPNTKRNYLSQLQKWLPLVQSHDLRLVEPWELLQIRHSILDNGLSDADHRQALAAMQGFFLCQGQQSRFQSLPENYAQEVFGSEKQFHPRKRERLLGPDLDKALDEGTI